MITTVLTKENLIQEFGTESHLGLVFEKLHLQWQEKGEVVCQFRINGMNLTQEDEAKLANAQLSEVDSFEVDSERPDDLLVAVLSSWVDELPRLIENADRLAQEIRFDGVEGRLSQFVDLVDSCQMLIESLLTLENVVKTNEWVSQDIWIETSQLTARAIGEALAAFEQKNFNSLAEVIEYDLGHSLQVWFNLLKEFKTKVLQERNVNPKISDKLFQKESGSTRAGDQES